MWMSVGAPCGRASAAIIAQDARQRLARQAPAVPAAPDGAPRRRYPDDRSLKLAFVSLATCGLVLLLMLAPA
jgi:hypothetical protein